MLGRLTPSLGRGVQFFPNKEGEWEREFDIAAQIGLSHLEWVWDILKNQLLNKELRARVRSRISDTGVPVKGVDLQFLTKVPIEQCPEDIFFRICEAMADINGEAIELPLLEGSTLLEEKREMRQERLARVAEIAKRYGLSVNLETDVPPEKYKELFDRIPDIFVVYDSGNSAHFGYDVVKEWEVYGSHIKNVQIKDRSRGGSTVALGKGDVDFKTLLSTMKKMRYSGLITLQTARGTDGREIETIQSYNKFIHDIYASI